MLSRQEAYKYTQYVNPSSHLVVLFDDVLRCQRVVLQISGQVEHVVGELLLQVVVMLQDGFQLCSRLTLVQRKTSAHGGTQWLTLLFLGQK